MSELKTVPSNTVAKDKLMAIIERVEKASAAQAELAVDIRELFAEAKSNGFNVKVLREVIRRRAWDPGERDAHDDTRLMYEQALGMWS